MDISGPAPTRRSSEYLSPSSNRNRTASFQEQLQALQEQPVATATPREDMRSGWRRVLGRMEESVRQPRKPKVYEPIETPLGTFNPADYGSPAVAKTFFTRLAAGGKIGQMQASPWWHNGVQMSFAELPADLRARYEQMAAKSALEDAETVKLLQQGIDPWARKPVASAYDPSMETAMRGFMEAEGIQGMSPEEYYYSAKPARVDDGIFRTRG
jgi:hypothetical protein